MIADRDDRIAEIEELLREMTWRGRQHFARRVEASGLTVPQYLALHTINRLGPNVTMSEVSDTLQLPPSSMTSIVDRLVREGLVERGTLATDRRAVVTAITPAGVELVRIVDEARHQDLVAMLEGVSDDDLERFRHVIAHLLDGVERALSDGHRPVAAA